VISQAEPCRAAPSSALNPFLGAACPLPLQGHHGLKRKESEALQVQHETQGANKKPRVVWSVEMHQQVRRLGCAAARFARARDAAVFAAPHAAGSAVVNLAPKQQAPGSQAPLRGSACRWPDTGGTQPLHTLPSSYQLI
jgi:hypothetical protein